MLLLRLFAAKECGVYVFCSLIGYLLFVGLEPAWWAPYVGILLTYHLFLVYCIFSTEEIRTRTFNLAMTIAGHLGLVLVCLAVRYEVVDFLEGSASSPPDFMTGSVTRMTARLIAVLTAVLVYGLVSFECSLLFGGQRGLAHEPAKDMEPVFVEMAARLRSGDEPLIAATGHDHNEWVQYCQRRAAKYYNPGLTPKEDFEQWLRARGKTQFPVQQSEAGVAAD